MKFFFGEKNQPEEQKNKAISNETIRIQNQVIKEFNSSSYNLHLAISNGVTYQQMKNENLERVFTYSKEIDSSKKFKEPKSKFWKLNRTNSENLGVQRSENYDSSD